MDYIKKLNEEGVVVIPKYLSKDDCKKIIENIDNKMLEPSSNVINQGKFSLFKFPSLNASTT